MTDATNAMVRGNEILKGGSTIAVDSINVVARNNIMGRSSIAYRGGLCEHNIYTELDWTQPPGTLGPGEFQASPAELWVDPAAGDYRLKVGSPAIDAGVNVGLNADIIGTAVPQGGRLDIGAYEY